LDELVNHEVTVGERIPLIPGGEADVKDAILDGLRSRILRLERHAPRKGPWASTSFAAAGDNGSPTPLVSQMPRWRLGCPAFDALLPAGIEANALHEIKGLPSTLTGASASDWMAGIGFAMRLAVRRLDALAEDGKVQQNTRPWVLWCWPRSLAGEFGVPSAAGFLRLGLDSSRLIIVETARASETLSAVEESLRAQSLAIVVAAIDEAELTPARRLSLAAGEAATPCLLVTHPASEPAAATATRWRVQRYPTAPHPFDVRAPGTRRFSIALERCKARPESAAQPAMLVEWSDEAHRFHLASVVADLSSHARGAGGGAFPGAVRPH
jgi:protein ImuA